jgi:DNA-binding CsgD family transcriptional regulator
MAIPVERAQQVGYRLTAREKEILRLLIGGYSMQKVADTLFVSYTTVNSHLKNLHRKLAVSNRAELVSKVIKEDLITEAA